MTISRFYWIAWPVMGNLAALRFCHRQKLIFSLCTWVLMPALAASASELDSVLKASNAAHLTVREAIAEGDGGKLASVFTSDGAVISPGGQTIEGRLTIRVTASLLLSTMGGGTLTTSRHDLSLIDDFAYETGEYQMRQPVDEDKFRSYSGKYTIIWKMEDKSWKIYRVIGLRP